MNELLETYKKLLAREKNRISEYTTDVETHSTEDRTALLVIEERIHLITDFIRDLEQANEKGSAID